MQSITWKCKPFSQLNVHELYTFLQLRSEVFVVEQQCVFQDADSKDQSCHHLMGWVSDYLAAYARIVPAGVSFAEISIGRVITSRKFRRAGFGKELMTQAVKECHQLYGKQAIKIGAQLYLKDFYQGFGFGQVGDIYLEDEIPHIEMLRE